MWHAGGYTYYHIWQVFPDSALIAFEARSELTHEYRFQLLHMALRSLRESEQAQLQIDEEGTLEIKLRFVAGSGGTELFSNFVIFPLADDEELTLGVGATADDAEV